jgi:hypothetical protein
MSEYQALLRCIGFSQPILLPYTIQLQTPTDQPGWPKRGWRKNFLCPTCKRVCAYTEQNVQWETPPSQAPSQHGEVVCTAVECEQLGCKALTQVFAVVDADKPKFASITSLAGIWNLRDVRCANGHQVIGHGTVRLVHEADWMEAG